MKKRLCSIIVLTFVILFSTMIVASAAPHLSWHSTSVYYDEAGRLVVQGYFENDGTEDIDLIHSVILNVYFKQNGTDWCLAGQGVWENIKVYLHPGDTSGQRLIITNPRHYRFDNWATNGRIDYHVLRID